MTAAPVPDATGPATEPIVPPPPVVPPGAPEPRFASLSLPSAPFWVVLIAAAVLTMAVAVAAPALLVFGIGGALSFFLVPVVNWLERRGVNRIAASAAVVATMVLVALMVLVATIFILVEQGVVFAQALPGWLAGIRADIEALDLPDWLMAGLDSIGATIDATLAATDWPGLALGLVQRLAGLLGFFLSFGLLPFFLFYLVKDQPRMLANFQARVPVPWRTDVARIGDILTRNVAQYVKGSLLVGGIMFVIVSVGMTLVGNVVPGADILARFALFLGLIAFALESLPQIGPILSYIPALILALTAGIEATVVVSIFYFIAFNIEGSILVPTFQGKLISFGGATVLVIVAMGFGLGGIIGAIVALPVAAIGRDLFDHFFDRAQELAGVPPLEPDALARPVADVGSAS